MFNEFGSWSPTGGTWEDMLKSGPTTATGVRWKYADWTGDTLPPSSTYFSVSHRYAFLKDDEDVQLYADNGFVGNVGNMRLHLIEIGATQRFIGPMRRGLFFDVGTSLGLGAANGAINEATPDPLDDPLYIEERKEDAFLIRAELNAGFGVQFSKFDLRFGIATGLGGTSALDGTFSAQTDIGTRMGGTIYLFD
jgi:hypothetical protein